MKNLSKKSLVLATVATLSLTLFSGLAAAATKSGFFNSTMQVQTRQVQTIQKSGINRFHAAINRNDVQSLEAGSTGDGAADDEDCQQFAVTINDQLDKRYEAVLAGEYGRSAVLNEAVNNQIDMAEDAGCYIVY